MSAMKQVAVSRSPHRGSMAKFMCETFLLISGWAYATRPMMELLGTMLMVRMVAELRLSPMLSNLDEIWKFKTDAEFQHS